MTKENTTAALICPRCRRLGHVGWERSRFVRDVLNDLSPGFVCIDRGRRDDPHLECTRCRSEPVQTSQIPRPAPHQVKRAA